MFLFVALALTLLGFILQFIGLRGLHGSIALYQITATLLMTIVRALLRLRVTVSEDNYLHNHRDDLINGYELDWLAMNICIPDDSQTRPRYRELDTWSMCDHNEAQCPSFQGSIQRYAQQFPGGLVWIASTLIEMEVSRPVLARFGYLPSATSCVDDKPNRPNTWWPGEHQCAVEAYQLARLHDSSLGIERTEATAARVVSFRARLAYMAESSESVAVFLGQPEWGDIECRTVAPTLARLLQDIANMIMPAHLNSVVWSTACRIDSEYFPLSGVRFRFGGRWKVNRYYLEGCSAYRRLPRENASPLPKTISIRSTLLRL
ncbi:hypothetical protein QBC35DRAFT_509204 [Podospora australis]|uniref:Uncharacterized protein n=1 Tax=Podospora australis TaxID=1536484 RepID=A0AAN6WIS3_9PEZI|nr:hypothetical protein QBC35DRAFT_509204 [Podospora australis]